MSHKSTRKRRSRKATNLPAKPHGRFPLTPHVSGRWMKKIRGKLHYFGRWGRVVNGSLRKLPGDDWWKPALDEYDRQRDDLYAGRTPRPSPDELIVGDLGNRFLSAKKRKLLAGELAQRTYQEYVGTCDRIVAAFGKDRPVDDLAADDFERLRSDIADQWGPVRVGNEVTRVKSVFKYAFDNGLIDRPVRYGSEFKKPSRSVLRRHKAASGPRLFTAEEIRRILAEADPVLKAMTLLAVNCGFGNSDCSDLQTSHVDFKNAVIDFPRPKTGIPRRCPLWPETVKALREAIDQRPHPKDDADADCVFLTAQRRRFVRPTEKSKTDAVAVQFGKLLRRLKINGRKGLGFYTLRHVFQTIADGSRDAVAVSHVMGHADNSMAGIYREHIDDSRLRAVADHVRAWLWEGDTSASKR